RDLDLARLLRGSRRRRLRRLLRVRPRGQQRDREHSGDDEFGHWYSKLRRMVSVGFGNASGSGGSVRVARTARSAAVSSVTVPLGLKIDASVIDPSRLMVNRMRLVPLAPWSWFHAERMRAIMVARYSGQQKSPVISSDDPEPGPPPVESPNP